MALKKKKGPILTSVLKGAVDLVPPRWRAKLGITLTAQKVPTDVGVTTLSGLVVGSEVQQKETDERLKVDVAIGDPTNVTLTEYVLTNEGQLGTRTMSIVTTATAAPTINELTEAIEWNNLGNEYVERGITTVAELFPATSVHDEGAGALVHRAIARFIDDLKVETTASVAAGTTATPATLALTGLGIISSEAVRVDATKVRTSATTVTGTKSTLTSVEYDELSGGVMNKTEEVVAAGTSGSALSGGIFAVIEAINPDWGIKTSRKVTNLTADAGKTWGSYEYVSLPSVLVSIEKTEWWHKEVTDANGNVQPRYLVQGNYIPHLRHYSGVYLVTYSLFWSTTAHSLGGATNFRPESFAWSSPFGSGSVPPCLHGTVTLSWSTGTTHPDLEYATGTSTFNATSPSGVSGTIVLQDEQVPHKGGFLRTVKSISV